MVAWSFRTNDTGQLSSVMVQRTWQCSTVDFYGIDKCLVLSCWTNRNFRCFVPTDIIASFSCIVTVCDHISSVLHGPAVRTLCSCWNRGDCWMTSHVAKCTRCWVVNKWITVVVAFREYVIMMCARIIHLVLNAPDCSRSLISVYISFPLWIFM